MNWLWHWKDNEGRIHLTTDVDEADYALHQYGGIMIWAEKINYEVEQK